MIHSAIMIMKAVVVIAIFAKKLMCLAACLPLLLSHVPAAPAESLLEGTVTQQTAAAGVKTTGVGFYFDTTVYVTLYDADDGLLGEIWGLCDRYERLFSKTVEGSDVWRINHADGQTIKVDPETMTLLRTTQTVHQVSGGLFSATIAPVVALWDFTGGTERMPTDAELEQCLPLVDDDRLVLGEDDTVTLPAGMSIDLGGVAKGYISDRIAELVRNRSTGSMVSLGGNMYVTGSKPGGSAWAIGVTNPDKEMGGMLAVVSLHDGTLVTSGTYERCFVKDGVKYHHILDPRTGYSAQTDLLSATIVCGNSMVADALATACILMGEAAAKTMLETLGYDGLFIKTDLTITCTEGFTEHLPTVIAQQ